MGRRRRTHRYEDGATIPAPAEEQDSLPPSRWPKILGIGLLAGVLAAGTGWLLYAWQKPRVLRVRVYTDFAFRQKRSDWEKVARERIAGLNGIYSAAGIRWELQSLDRADPTPLQSGLDVRRKSLAEMPGQDADLLLGLSGAAAGSQTVAVVPFTRA